MRLFFCMWPCAGASSARNPIFTSSPINTGIRTANHSSMHAKAKICMARPSASDHHDGQNRGLLKYSTAHSAGRVDCDRNSAFPCQIPPFRRAIATGSRADVRYCNTALYDRSIDSILCPVLSLMNLCLAHRAVSAETALRCCVTLISLK